MMHDRLSNLCFVFLRHPVYITTHSIVKVDFSGSTFSNGITDRHRCIAFDLDKKCCSDGFDDY